MLTDKQIIAKYGQSGIYNLFWPEQGYFYIGQAMSLKNRKAIHICLLKKGIHDNERLQRIYNKYGLPQFEILEECNVDRLQNREQLYLEAFFDDKNNCNMLPSAKSSIGYKHTEETKLRFKELMAMPERRQYLSEVNKGHKRNVGNKHSEETKLKMSKSGKGKPKTENQLAAFKIWSSKLKGDNHPCLGQKRSTEQIDRMKAAKTGELNPNFGKITHNARKVIDMSTGIVYDSIKKCALEMNMNYGSLKSALSKNRTNKTTIKFL